MFPINCVLSSTVSELNYFLPVVFGDFCFLSLYGRILNVIIIMEICKAPTLRLKALNKYSITHIMYIEMEMLSATKMYIRKEERKEKKR